MTPLILTGFPYLPGFTHLPGIALTLLAMAAVVLHRFILAGSILALLAFTKVLFLPIAGLIIVVVIIV
ncbi:hypothetical protein LJD40_26365, partial [Escherichia coli]|uniref:hypothetical protein n=1 Tax=Escherichia coli TaxID=562 RepID=UPI001D09C778